MIDADRYADRYYNDLETRLMRRPKCSCCHEHIQDEAYIELPNKEIMCFDCEKENAYDLWFEFGRGDYITQVEEG